MKSNFCKYILVLIVLLVHKICIAQVENVIVETYYVTDANDEADTIGGGIEIGTTTYRVYIDLKEGSRLKKIYGDQYHPIVFKSTKKFFNNKVDGQSFGYLFNKNRLDENTVALDTWLTLGQISNSNLKLNGILKSDDRDGQLIAGSNNDEGLLINNNSQIGIPLTQADGIDTINYAPSGMYNYGILNALNSSDSTIFGSLIDTNQFVSYDAGIQNSGTIGIIRNKNQILIGQFSTKGEFSFEINVEVEEPDGINTKIVKYVARKDTLFEDEKLSPFLRYPFLCGCTNANFIEYDDIYACEFIDSCKTPIILGCMDTSACNYDPKANFNVQSLCCYPGYCNDRNLEIVCPEITSDFLKFFLFPNPAKDNIILNLWLLEPSEVSVSIENIFGVVAISDKNLGQLIGNTNQTIDISSLESGVYYFRIRTGSYDQRKVFIKK
jgi:hypothetical protein